MADEKEKQQDLQIQEVEDIVYAAPKAAEVFVEEGTNKVKEFKDLSIWEQLVEASKKYSMAIHEPKKNCKKCFGRGYTGFDVDPKDKNRIPHPCRCIFEKVDLKKMDDELLNSVPNNRKGRKAMEKYKKQEAKKIKNNASKKVEKLMEQYKQKEATNDTIQATSGTDLEGQRPAQEQPAAQDSQSSVV